MKQAAKELLFYLGIWTAALVVAFLIPLNLHAQANCNSLIAIDEANVFHDPAAIIKSASGLIDQGADVHVVSLQKLSVGTLLDAEKGMEALCPSWLVDGHRKPNLFVMMVAPQDRKKNAFFGAAYSPAFPTEDSVNLIYSQAANPFFRQSDYSGGVSTALRDFSAKIAAYHDQQKHPAEQVINNQATDLSGFWTIMGWFLFLAALGLVTWGTIAILASRRRFHESILAAQSEAVKARDRAMRLYNSVPPTNSLSSRLVDLTNSIKNDPSTDGLTAVQYLAIRDVWNDFASDIDPSPSIPPRHSRWRTVRSKHGTPPQAPAPVEHPAAPYPVYAQQSTVVVNQSNGNDFLTGMLIGEELERPVYVEDRPVYREPEPRYDPPASSGSDSSWTSSSDSGSSGSDSSWSSSDSSSSSDFGGGGSDSSW